MTDNTSAGSRERIAQSIMAYYEKQSLPCASHEHLSQCLQLFNQLSLTEKSLSSEQLAALNASIKAIPTGRQKHIMRARDETLVYLQAVCGWTLPRVKAQQFVERDYHDYVNLARYSALADQLYRAYQTESDKQIKQNAMPSLAWTVLTLMIDVAAVPLQYWCQRLNDPTPLSCLDKQLTVGLTHPSTLSYFDDTEPVSTTHYAMTPLAARVFMRWQHAQKMRSPTVTLKGMTHALNTWFSAFIDAPLSALQWHHMIRALWLHRFQLPPEVLKDFSDPMRHVSALPRKRLASSTAHDDVNCYAPPPISLPAQHTVTQKVDFTAWPHKTLIKSFISPATPRPAPPPWQSHNLLPRLLFDYVSELEREGGVKKKKLAASTLERYTHFKKEFSNAPLPFDVAIDADRLNQWAKEIYQTLASDSLDQWRMYQFFRFMVQLPITEHLDLSLFEKPMQSVTVDALTLQPDDVHGVVSHLLEHAQSPLQSLFSAVSTLLAYYAALRRGELLRLRLQDIRCVTEKGQQFDIYITNTHEGNTKSGVSRSISITLPEGAAKLLRLVLDIKKSCPPNSPLIGLTQESITARAQHYLLPITKVLKHYFGEKARFHHLRHAGAKLLYQQALCMANNLTPSTWYHSERPASNALLSTTFVKQRFNYWLEGRAFTDMNNMLLFDEVGRALGHQYYATTRLHYIHSMDWVAAAFLPQNSHYSRAQLRYVLGMQPNSNDITRILSQIDPHYRALSPQEKKTYTPLISHSTLIQRLLKHASPDADSPAFCADKSLDERYWLSVWTESLSQINADPMHFCWESPELLQQLRAATLPYQELGSMWQSFGHYQGITFNNKQRTALRPLGEMMLMHGDAPQLIVECACNQRVKKALQILRQSSLNVRFHITLHQNRKRLDSHKWAFIQEYLLGKGDRASKVVIPKGATTLSIGFSLPTTHVAVLRQFAAWWNALLTSN